MDAVRQIYESVPDMIQIPPELRRRRVEVIILPLDEEQPAQVRPDNDIVRFFGCIPDMPDREVLSDYEQRLELP